MGKMAQTAGTLDLAVLKCSYSLIPPHAALSLPRAERVMAKRHPLEGQDESFASG